MKFKHEKDRMFFTTLVSPLIMIYADLEWYAKFRHNVDLVVTATVSTKKEDADLNRTSTAHSEKERRALDIRTKDLDPFVVSDIIEYINNKEAYKKYRYLSNSGQYRLAYFHIGTAPHIHLAVHKNFSKNFGIKSE
jgi:hypothetical protein